MAHTVHGLLRKPPFIKQLENSTMFIVELSEMIKDYQTQEKTYTNYKAMLFAKSDAAIAYYNKAFAEGSFVVVSCEKLKVDKFDADNGTTYITLMMDNARLEGAKFDDVNDGNWGQPQQPAAHPQQQQNYAPQQQAPQQQQYSQRNPQQMPSQAQREAQQRQQAQPQYNEPPMNFDDDIPF